MNNMEDFGTECESNWFQYSCSLNPGCKYGVILSWNYCTSVHSSLHSHFVHTFSLGHHKQRLFVCLHSRTTYGFNGLVYEITLILNSKQRIELVTWKSLCEYFFFFFFSQLNISIIHGDDAPYKHLYFSSACANAVLNGLLSGWGIV